MSDLKHAHHPLGMAHKDFAAVKGMLNRESFADEIFGFHVQQAIEKGLKAWLAAVRISYPLKHELALLFDLLEKNGQDVFSFKRLDTYTDFAVDFRYLGLDLATVLPDRKVVGGEVEFLLEHVDQVLEKLTAAEKGKPN